MVDVVTEHAGKRLLNEILCADDLVLMSGSLRSALKDKGLKVNVEKTKTMVGGTEGEIVLSKIDSCGISGKKVKSNAVCCTLHTVYEVDTWEMYENEKGLL